MQFGPLFYRSLEKDKTVALKVNKGHFDRHMNLSDESKLELLWWTKLSSRAPSPIRRESPTLEIRTDASGAGWGATNMQVATGGRWNESELVRAKNNEINYLETLAVGLGLKSFCSDLRDAHVLVRSDNVTAVTYLNCMGGSKSLACNKVAHEIWEWCIDRDIWISVAHLPGRENTEADRKSRKFNDRTEWMLNREDFHKVVSFFGLPEIDLFASRLNAQLSRYVSWLPDPNAESVDAFSLNWREFNFYAFPPFCLIPKCLQKIRMDKAQGLLVVPNWPTQAWFPCIKAMMKGEPLLLKRKVSLLTQPVSNVPHPLHERLDLLCFRLCGDPLINMD